jgi:hypothetical protein
VLDEQVRRGRDIRREREQQEKRDILHFPFLR